MEPVRSINKAISISVFLVCFMVVERSAASRFAICSVGTAAVAESGIGIGCESAGGG